MNTTFDTAINKTADFLRTEKLSGILSDPVGESIIRFALATDSKIRELAEVTEDAYIYPKFIKKTLVSACAKSNEAYIRYAALCMDIDEIGKKPTDAQIRYMQDTVDKADSVRVLIDHLMIRRQLDKEVLSDCVDFALELLDGYQPQEDLDAYTNELNSARAKKSRMRRLKRKHPEFSEAQLEKADERRVERAIKAAGADFDTRKYTIEGVYANIRAFWDNILACYSNDTGSRNSRFDSFDGLHRTYAESIVRMGHDAVSQALDDIGDILDGVHPKFRGKLKPTLRRKLETQELSFEATEIELKELFDRMEQLIEDEQNSTSDDIDNFDIDDAHRAAGINENPDFLF